MYGNRGVLHDRDGRIVRRAQVRRWLVCELSFRGRRRPLLRPGRYTELFLLDEAVALAAGHRPCAECRHGAYREFRRLWTAERALTRPPSAGEVDDVLHVERALDRGRRRTRPEAAGTLPDGTFLALPEGPHVVVARGMRPWSHERLRAVARAPGRRRTGADPAVDPRRAPRRVPAAAAPDRGVTSPETLHPR